MSRSPRPSLLIVTLLLIWLVHGQAAAFELAFVSASGQSYAQPHDIVLSPDQRHLYVADKYNHQIKILAADDALVLTLGSGRGGSGDGEFDRPEGVVIRGSDVWFSDTYNDCIVRYRIVQ